MNGAESTVAERKSDVPKTPSPARSAGANAQDQATASKTTALLLRPPSRTPRDWRAERLIITKIAWDDDTQRRRVADITAAWIAPGRNENEGEPIPMVIGIDRDWKGFVVLDLRPGAERAEFHGPSPEAALDAYVNHAEAHQPAGTIKLEVGPNAEGVRPQKRMFETQVKFHIDKFGENAGWGALGLTGLGLGLVGLGVTAPAGAVLLGAAALGVEASAAALASHNADPETTGKQFAIDGVQLLASLVNLRALGDLAKLAMQVPNVAKGMIGTEFGLNFGSIGLIAPDWYDEFVAVKNDDSLSVSERTTRLTKILLNVALQTGFLWLAKRGALSEWEQSSRELTKSMALTRAENAEAKRVADQRAAEKPHYVAPTPLPKPAKEALGRRILGQQKKVERWVQENLEATRKLPAARQLGVNYHVTAPRELPKIMEKGLVSARVSGNAVITRNRRHDQDCVWFNEGTPWFDDILIALAIPTHKLLELGGRNLPPVGKDRFFVLEDRVMPQGIPFEEFAVVVPAGNGYVVPLYIPPDWSGPPFPVHPLWNANEP